ncbi:hypothetical protein GQR58_000072 [Nymphon striatum]|nr:hypothetical protein GQR58_000072 [Nymphon striatum]
MWSGNGAVTCDRLMRHWMFKAHHAGMKVKLFRNDPTQLCTPAITLVSVFDFTQVRRRYTGNQGPINLACFLVAHCGCQTLGCGAIARQQQNARMCLCPSDEQAVAFHPNQNGVLQKVPSTWRVCLLPPWVGKPAGLFKAITSSSR